MTYKIKKLFSYLFKTRTLILSVILVFFCLFLPVRHASANWVWDMISGIATIPFAFFYLLLGYMSILFSGFAGIVLNWVIGPNFTTLSYTNPAGNPIIRAGLEITQGFVNMLLVLILVYIAIATILRLAGHETKKLLVTFVVVALLVNFAPVICGLVVDASNIIMNFFISELAGLDVFTTNMGRISESFISMFSWDQFNSAERSWARLFSVIGVTAFNFFLGFALLIFAALFVFRRIMIWILVILSPLAFACYILPRTREYFNKWWKQFLSWSFIGVTAGFFLYLGFRLVLIAPEIITPPETEFGTTFDGMLPYYVPIAFLFIGLIIGLQTSAMGASTVINLAKRGQKWAGGKTWRGIKPHIESKLRTKEAVHRVTQAVEKVPGVRWFLPDAVRNYGEFRPTIDADQKRLEPLSSREIGHEMATGTLVGSRFTGGMMELLNRGDMEDLFTAFRKKHGVKNNEDLFKIADFGKKLERPIEMAFESGYQSKLLRGSPRLARFAAGKKWAFGYNEFKGTQEEIEKQAVTKATAEARPKNTQNWERQELEDPYVVESMAAHWEQGRFNALTNIKNGREAFLQTMDTNFTNWASKAYPDEAKKLKAVAQQVEAETDPQVLDKLKKEKEKAEKKLVDEYRKHLEATYRVSHSGYYRAMESNRFQQAGFRYVQVVSEEEELPLTTPLGGAGVKPTPTRAHGGPGTKPYKEPRVRRGPGAKKGKEK